MESVDKLGNEGQIVLPALCTRDGCEGTGESLCHLPGSCSKGDPPEYSKNSSYKCSHKMTDHLGVRKMLSLV